jgi:hypothetical protein
VGVCAGLGVGTGVGLWDGTVITNFLEEGKIVGVPKFLDALCHGVGAFNESIVRILHRTVALST